MAAGRIPTTANSPLTAKGDLFSYSTAPARLAVGSNGETLVADSVAATGLAYKTKGVFNGLTTTGDTIYSSSGTTQSRLGIGSTGQVLTVASGVPSWAAVSVNPSYTLISTSNPTTGSSITFSSLSGYSEYFIVMYPRTIGVGSLTMTLNSDTGANYLYVLSSTGLTQSSTGDTAMRFGYAGAGASTFYGGIIISGANSSGKKVVQSISGGGSGADAGVTWGYWNGTATVSSITISTGNTFQSGAFFSLLGA